MSFLYGLGQGLNRGAENLVNSVAIAERIKNSREHLRLRNEAQKLAEEQWGMQKQQQELALREYQLKVDALENEMVATKAADFFVDGMEYGNYKQFQKFALTNPKMKEIMNTLGLVNIEGVGDYTDSSIDSIAGNTELANQVKAHKNGFLVATDSQGNKTLVDATLLAGQMGVQERVNSSRVRRMNQLQERMLQQAQTLGAKEKLKEAQEDPSKFGSGESLEFARTISPAGSLSSTKQSVYDKKQQAESDEWNTLNKINVKQIDEDEELAKKDETDLYRIAVTADNSQIRQNAADIGIQKKLYELNSRGLLDGESLQAYASSHKDKSLGAFIHTYTKELSSTSKSAADAMTKLDTWNIAKQEMIESLTKVNQFSGKSNLQVLKDRETFPIIDNAFSAIKRQSGTFSKYMQGVQTEDGKSAAVMFFNTYLKNISGQSVTGQEFTRNYEALGFVDRTDMGTALAGMKNVILADLEEQRRRRDAQPTLYAIFVGDRLIDRMESSLAEIEKLQGVKTKQAEPTPEQKVAKQKQNDVTLQQLIQQNGGL